MQKSLGERLLAPFNHVFAGTMSAEGSSYGPAASMHYDEFPSISPTAPLVMFWHGGSWRTGHRGMYRFVGGCLQRMGAHVFVLDYPKTPHQAFPGFIDDAEQAVAHVREMYPDRKLYLMGHSAGGNTALITALRGNVAVDGAVSIAGVCTLAKRIWYDVFGEAMNEGLHDPRTYVESSPQSVKYLLLHGAADHIVVPTDSISLHHKLRRNGRDSSLSILPFIDHILILPLILFGPLRRTRRKLRKFLGL